MRFLPSPSRPGPRIWPALLVTLAVASPAWAGEQYFLIIFASQRIPAQAKYSHSFATFIKATGEGPCLAVITEGLDSLYADDLREDTRWPAFGPRAVAAGLRSLLAFRLFADDTLGALSLYARLPRAYGATDRAAGLIFATHAGIALAAAQDRAQEALRAEHLAGGLVSREVIGQAQGILMEREGITAAQAFDVLCRASQHLNLKLRTVAQDLVDTGVRPEVGPDA